MFGTRSRSCGHFSMILASVILTLPSCAVQRPTEPANLAIVHVNVVDVKRGVVVRDQTVLVAGDSIQRVMSSVGARAPDADTIIDGAGAYLIPGLWDMHAHLRGNGLPDWIGKNWIMPLLIAHGVTGIRDMSSDCEEPDQGPVCLTQMREWQAQIDAGDLLGPRVLALSTWPVNPPWDSPMTEEQARQLVRAFAAKKIDLIKVSNRLSLEAFASIMAEAGKLGIQVGGHIPLRVSSKQASEAGLRSMEHARDFLFDCFPGSAEFRRTTETQDPSAEIMRSMVEEHDPATCDEIFRAFVRNGTWYVPTHVTRRSEAFAGDSVFRNDPRRRYIPPTLMEDWIEELDDVAGRESASLYSKFYWKGLEITGAAHRAGVRILLGTDGGDTFVFPGSSVQDELSELVSAGLSPADALRSATLYPAEFLDLAEHYGSVEARKRADLVLLSGNPLENIGKTRDIVGVVFQGRFLRREFLDELLRAAEAAANRPL